MRNRASAYTAARTPNSPTKDRFDIAPLPRGEAGIAATIGGNGYGVSRHSLHPEQAAMLVRFLCSRDEQLRRSRSVALPSTIAQVYNDAEVMAINPCYSRVLEVFSTGKASRPSTAARKMYPDVSRAYFETVNEVLSRRKNASQAAADLQKELTRILKTDATGADAALERKPAAASP